MPDIVCSKAMRSNYPLNSFVIRVQGIQPGSLSCVLPLAGLSDGINKRNKPLIYYAACPSSMIADHWNIPCKVSFPNYSDEKGSHGQVDVPDQMIFSLLKTDQKNKIMQALFDDNVKAMIYHTQTSYRELIEFAEQFEIPMTAKQSLPKLITTKSIYFPDYLNGKGDFATRRGPMFDYVLQNVSHEFSNPQYVHQENWSLLVDAAQAHNNGRIHPTQFVAIHGSAMQDVIDNQIYTGVNTAQFLKHHLNMTVNKTDDEILKNLKQAKVTVPQDGWVIYANEPYNSFPILCTAFLQRAIEILQELESEFILPYYDVDPSLAMAEQKMQAFRTNYDPTHWSNISERQIKIFDQLNEEKIDYKEVLYDPRENYINELLNKEIPAPYTLHNGQSPLGLN
jgi:hypothetical protein